MNVSSRVFFDLYRSSRLVMAGAALAGLALLGGCAANQNSASVYRSDQAQREQVVRLATVEGVRQVSIQNSNSGVGTIGGAVVGGVAGNSIGGGRGQIITSVLGAIAGGLAGNAIESNVQHSNGLEITVRYDSGEVRTIVQSADEPFYVGDRVRILSGGGTTRITHLN